MEGYSGKDSLPIWLLGDSIPPQWAKDLNSPFDPRHPVIHNIWTPVINVIQDEVYRFRNLKLRVDTKIIYITNAVQNRNDRPNDYEVDWKIEEEVKCFGNQINNENPNIILSFGSFAFEFARRALFSLDPETEYRYFNEPKIRFKNWNTKRLGEQFKARINDFEGKIDSGKTIILPLLHRSISGGRFLRSHALFCDPKEIIASEEIKYLNYFTYVGEAIAEKLIEHRDKLKIWVE
jgi:hypothetical protein